MFCSNCCRFANSIGGKCKGHHLCPTCCTQVLETKWIWEISIDDGTAKLIAEVEDFDIKSLLSFRKSMRYCKSKYVLSIESRAKYLGEITYKCGTQGLSTEEDIDPEELTNITSEPMARKTLATFVAALSLNSFLSLTGRLIVRHNENTVPIRVSVAVQSRVYHNQFNNREVATQMMPILVFRVVSAIK